MTETILDLIRIRDYVTFVEIMKALGNQAKGDQVMASVHQPNVILWANMAPEVIHAIQSLVDRRLISYAPAQVSTYLIDGCILQLPLARRIPEGGYKTPHWLPVCFRPVSNKKKLPLQKTVPQISKLGVEGNESL